MTAIARYAFTGSGDMSQLTFPAGAQIHVQTRTNQDGWAWGSYQNQKGWFPASYVDMVVTPPQRVPQPPSTGFGSPATSTATTTSSRNRSHVIDVPPGIRASAGFREDEATNIGNAIRSPRTPFTLYDNAHKEENDNDEGNVFRPQGTGDEPFPLMGGVPGTLFERPVALVENNDTNDMVDTMEESEAEPAVDIYRHAPPRKRNNRFKAEYTPEISVQVTPKARPVAPYPYGAKVTPETNPQKVVSADTFWKAHPGRVPGNTSANQAYELERAFEGLDETASIEIVAETKKNKSLHIPKTVKRKWKKVKESLMKSQ